MQKQCSLCRAAKSLDDFYADPRGKLGRSGRCKSCHGNYYRSNVSKGLCRECGKPRGDSGTTLRCAECSGRARVKIGAIQAARRASGLCVVCASPRITTSFCDVCWYKDAARGLGRDRRGRVERQQTGPLWQVLRAKLIAQEFRCALTGELMIIGENAEIDHILPKSRGGGNDPTNLRWVTSAANVMKWNRTDEELAVMCRQILRTLCDEPVGTLVPILRTVPSGVGA